MDNYIFNFDSVFWLTLGGLTFTFFGVMLKYCFKSKCSRVSCCGLTIERDIAGELEEERLEINHGLNEENKV